MSFAFRNRFKDLGEWDVGKVKLYQDVHTIEAVQIVDSDSGLFSLTECATSQTLVVIGVTQMINEKQGPFGIASISCEVWN